MDLLGNSSEYRSPRPQAVAIVSKSLAANDIHRKAATAVNTTRDDINDLSESDLIPVI